MQCTMSATSTLPMRPENKEEQSRAEQSRAEQQGEEKRGKLIEMEV